MGIKGLSQLIADRASGAIRENEFKNYFGRKVAIDASMCLYQFLVAVRSEGSNLTNEAGETTSHLMGMFYRTIRMVNHGIKPVYVFDGKPPSMKGGELAKRTEKRADATKSLEAAKEGGDAAEVEKFTRRLVRVTPQHNKDCQDLLKLMGIPFIIAPCEAEAQCAELVKGKVVYATVTEDMDALTFGTTVLLRDMTQSAAKKLPVREFHLKTFLEEAGLTMPEFIDLSILLGCDYCDKIRGVGPKSAVTLIKQHHTIENILANADAKFLANVPPDWPYKQARELFVNPEVTPASECSFKWGLPDAAALMDFMHTKNGFAEKSVQGGIDKLTASRSGAVQGRLDSFFTKLPSTGPKKRKVDEKKKGSSKKKAKGGGGKFRR